MFILFGKKYLQKLLAWKHQEKTKSNKQKQKQNKRKRKTKTPKYKSWLFSLKYEKKWKSLIIEVAFMNLICFKKTPKIIVRHIYTLIGSEIALLSHKQFFHAIEKYKASWIYSVT